MAVKVLMVEDDVMVRRMYERAFAIEGMDFVTASDGTIVLESILLNRPDIIILDIMMPNFNGLETLRELKENKRTRNVPVIILSAHDDQRLIDQALQLGAKRYLIKNVVEPAQVIEIIHDILKTDKKS